MAVAELDDIALDVAQTDIPKSYEENRVDDFMAAGTRLIWVIDP